MSAAYKPVGWNANKIFYDSVLGVAVILYLLAFTWAAARPVGVQPYDDATVWMRAYGSCALLMLSFVLCIGPLARLDPRFLPLLYNRRHFGVATCIVALMHARRVLGWYFSFSDADPYVALFSSNTSIARLAGFPFEWFGAAALLVLIVLAATSHDFWLKFLTPPIWKSFHMGLYLAYACIVAHVALGAMLTRETQALHFLVPACGLVVVMLHLAAAYRQMKSDHAEDVAGLIPVGAVHQIKEGRAIVVPIAGAESVAIFRNRGRLSAIANACAHQNGPLGEGRIIDGCVTCPWHGFQYRIEDGCAPPPFTERLATYNLRVKDGVVLLDPRPNAPGTYVKPIGIEEGHLER